MNNLNISIKGDGLIFCEICIVGVGGRCKEHLECPKYADCIDRKCQCIENTKEKNNACIYSEYLKIFLK